MGGASVEHLSLLAHLSSLSLCHPPLIMVAPSDSQLPELRPFLPLRSSLPCDVHLLNLRTLEDPQVRNTWPIIYWWGCHRLCWLGKFYRICCLTWLLKTEDKNKCLLLLNRKQEVRHRKWLFSSTGKDLTAAPPPSLHRHARGARTRRCTQRTHNSVLLCLFFSTFTFSHSSDAFI